MNSAHVKIARWSAEGAVVTGKDLVAVEEPLELRVGGRSVAITMRTPGHDRELAAGFLLSEGIIRHEDDLLDVLLCRDLAENQESNAADAVLAPSVAVDFARLTRHVFTSSSCGLCGKATLDSIFRAFAAVDKGPTFSAHALAAFPKALREAQPIFAETGGLHASALFSRTGELRCVREDVGRHNAFDKVLGWALLNGKLPLRETAVVVSGRISFELVLKAVAAGIPLIAGIGAPSSLAVSCAQRAGQTLVGFLREDRYNVYCGEERLTW